MLPMRRFAKGSKQALGNMMNPLSLSRNRHEGGFKQTYSSIKGKRRRGSEKRRWKDNIKEWTGMDFASSTREADTGQGGKRIFQSHL